MLISKLLSNIARPLLEGSAHLPWGRREGYQGPPVHIVSATRAKESDFWKSSHLGPSFRRANYTIPLKHSIAFENTCGLSQVYNQAIDSMDDRDIAVFVHDDIALYDFFLPFRLAEGLRHFDVIGVAGNAAPAADHAAWCMFLRPGNDAITDQLPQDPPLKHSGGVNQLHSGHEVISRFGPIPMRVALLDGLFIAARVSTLRRAGARFDERFMFHFYDLDFCRTCTAKGLKLGTWPIALGHASRGAYGAPDWALALADYRAKWGMTIPPI